MAIFRNFGFLKNKVTVDMDLQDETFVQPDEMVGYGNEGIDEAFGEILGLKQNYYKTKWFVPLVNGNDLYPLPPNIYENKIRSILYQNGSIIYEVRQIREKDHALKIAYVNEYGIPDWYRYDMRNDLPGLTALQLVPPARETSIFPPNSNPILQMMMEYIREANRIPLTGEFYYTEPITPAAVNTTTDVITVVAGQGVASQLQITSGLAVPGQIYWPYVNSPIPYVTGDQVQFTVNPFVSGSVLPAPLVAGTTYYVIAVTANTIKLATSAANAAVGTKIDLTTVGTGLFNCSVAGTVALQNATVVDLPGRVSSEFVMQWMKVRSCSKEGDPRYEALVAELQSKRKMMVDTLTEMIEDNDTEIQGDYSHYDVMS